MHLAGTIIAGVGAVFFLFGGLGLVRLPDVYNRLQAGAKCSTLGACFTILGVGIMEPSWLPKTVLIALFILVTNPISNHALGRASCKRNVPLWEKSVVDRTREFKECRDAAAPKSAGENNGET
jgi:multicomponent Na+:H+ antiporter subunit G